MKIIKLAFFLIILEFSLLVFAQNKLIDEVHFFHVNGYPSLEYSNKTIKQINSQAGTNLKDWNDVYKGSIALEAKKNLNKNLDLGVLLEYSSGALKDEDTGSYGTWVKLYQDWDVLVSGINLYYNFNKEGKFNPFIGGGVLYYLKIDSKTKVDVSTSMFYEKIRSDFSSNGLGLGAFAGIEYNIAKHWSLDLLANYTWADFKEKIKVTDSILGQYYLEAEANFTGPGIGLGVSYKF